MDRDPRLTAEQNRLIEDAHRELNWKRWGPYLSERQWATVREDYSADGDCWNYFPHDHARSRTYRWGEDGLLGWCDRECRLCFSVALWNGRDPILKERLFGLTGPQGNHGEDVKELYYYLDSSPTHAYCRALYKYPQAAYPYEQLVKESARRSRNEREFEITDTGVFDESRYFDVFAEYAKGESIDDTLIRLTVVNRGPERARLHVLPTLWFRNGWSWGCTHEGCEIKPLLWQVTPNAVQTSHATLGPFRWEVEAPRELIFTENETNVKRLFGVKNATPYVKDAFHEYVVYGRRDMVNPKSRGTKVAAVCVLDLAPGEQETIRVRLSPDAEFARRDSFGPAFDQTFQQRIDETDDFYRATLPPQMNDDERHVARQAYAGLLWSRQFYHYVATSWIDGDPEQPPPPPQHKRGRNRDWRHLFSRDVLSVPDKWEYPWFAAWDLAFHMIPMCRVDPEFAKQQLVLLLREWYMHPNGELPAYEFNFSDVNPPVHAWAVWRVYKMTAKRGCRDRLFLARCFQKLLMNFTWWVNRKDVEGKNIFGGGFLGLDNIGIFDRSQPLPDGASLEQADGTAWMAFYCGTMLSMALELAIDDPCYEDVASKFFEHFVAIVDAINTVGGTGLWDADDGFYYDELQVHGTPTRIKTRSLVGVIPLLAVEILEEELVNKLPGFAKRMQWFLDHRPELSRFISFVCGRRHDDDDDDAPPEPHGHYLLAIPSRTKLQRVLKYLLDENEFLSPFGLRSLSHVHGDRPFEMNFEGTDLSVHYTPGESDTAVFGGNSNWRGPVWFPINFLFIEALERYGHYYGKSFMVECPVGSGKRMTLDEVGYEIARRMSRLFLPDANGRRPCHGDDARYANDPNFRDLVLFYEHFHGDTGRGIGASHQTGWTALAARCLEMWAKNRPAEAGREKPPAAKTPAPGETIGMA